MDRITVVVVTWNGAHLLPSCLDSLRQQDLAHRVVVVDNASNDGTDRLLGAGYPETHVLRLPANTGFAGGVQAALPLVGTEFVALLNNDARAEPGWLAALLDALDADPRAVAATSRLVLEDGRVNNAGGALTRHGVGYDRGLGRPDGPPFDRDAEVAAFSGGAVLLRTAAVRAVGGLPAHFFLYYEDTDTSWRLRRAGGRIRYVASAVVHHRHSATSDQTSAAFAFYNQRNQLLMLVRNAPLRLVGRALARFVALTAVRAVRPTAAHTGRLGPRLRVLGAVARLLPAELRARRVAQRQATVSRRADAARWLGVESRPLP